MKIPFGSVHWGFFKKSINDEWFKNAISKLLYTSIDHEERLEILEKAAKAEKKAR